jgi:glycolate oxidase FAD binding subunit
MSLVETLCDRLAAKKPVAVVGGDTKSFLAGRLKYEPLSMREHRGVVNYEPTELVLTAKSGTTLREIEACLSDARQMLPFEPPRLGDHSTIGGVMASGFSGPRRMHLGSARDCVLGVRLINGLGQHLKFGGEVMKNVAGYDLSRLSVGAFGTLGILTEISVKVLPIPEKEQTQVLECTQADALDTLSRLGRRPYPISAASWIDGFLYIRLSGAASGVESAGSAIGGETLKEAEQFWFGLRDLTASEFHSSDYWPWRVSVAPTTPANVLDSFRFDWAGGQRWIRAPRNDFSPFEWAARLGGHATCFSRDRESGTGLQPLTSGILRLNQRVKEAMDPYGLINRGRLLEEAH